MTTWIDEHRLSRREFLSATAAVLLVPGFARGATRQKPLRVVFVTDGASAELTQGVRFGAAEMEHTARLLRSTFELVETTAADAAARARSASVIVCGSASAAAELAERDALVLVAAPRIASSCADVLRLGLTDAEVDSLGALVELWHPSLFRFGAAQLNERYERAHGAGMSSAAWCGWMAVKAAWEAAQRSDGSSAGMRAYLTSVDTRLDGHKGEALRFDARTGWLVQPLYRVKEGAVSGDVPSADALAVVMREGSCA